MNNDDDTVFLELRLMLDVAPDEQDEVVLVNHSRSYESLELAVPDLLALEAVFNCGAADQLTCDRRLVLLDGLLGRLERARAKGRELAKADP